MTRGNSRSPQLSPSEKYPAKLLDDVGQVGGLQRVLQLRDRLAVVLGMAFRHVQPLDLGQAQRGGHHHGSE